MIDLKTEAEVLAKQERQVYSHNLLGIGKREQEEEYCRITAERALLWPAEKLDAYARKGEDLTKGGSRRNFIDPFYLLRIGLFRDAANEKFVNEFGYTLKK